MENISIEEKAQARVDYHRELRIRNHAPVSGRCFHCNKDILEKLSLAEAMKSYITGCPHCNRSFVS